MGGAGAFEGSDDLILGFRQRTMLAVAVGRFDQQHVRLRDDFLRVAQHRAVGHAEITREDQLAGSALAADRDLQPG